MSFDMLVMLRNVLVNSLPKTKQTTQKKKLEKKNF